jgi:hypothetical protein
VPGALHERVGGREPALTGDPDVELAGEQQRMVADPGGPARLARRRELAWSQRRQRQRFAGEAADVVGTSALARRVVKQRLARTPAGKPDNDIDRVNCYTARELAGGRVRKLSGDD